tara:strand:+ start:4065 stop:4634 length:570 start_codon:yes stop_codon:yes gene_type:complete
MFGKNPGTDETWKRIPENSIGAELGVWQGDSSEKFLKRAKHVHLVDSWSPIVYEESDEHGDYEAYLDRYSKLVKSRDPKEFVNYYNRIYEGVKTRFFGRPVTIHRMSTSEWFDTFVEPLDWIYVDASHAYEGCLHDLTRSLEVLKPGGILFGDDYGDKKLGVKKAVDKFISNTGLKLNNFHSDQFEIRV